MTKGVAKYQKFQLIGLSLSFSFLFFFLFLFKKFFIDCIGLVIKKQHEATNAIKSWIKYDPLPGSKYEKASFGAIRKKKQNTVNLLFDLILSLLSTFSLLAKKF